MAHLTDDELKDLKTRVIQAMGSGATIARSTEYLYQLITEVEGHRKPKPKIGKITGAELDVKKAEPEPEATPAPPISEKNIPTSQMLPEETKELVEKTKPEAKKDKKGKDKK